MKMREEEADDEKLQQREKNLLIIFQRFDETSESAIFAINFVAAAVACFFTALSLSIYLSLFLFFLSLYFYFPVSFSLSISLSLFLSPLLLFFSLAHAHTFFLNPSYT